MTLKASYSLSINQKLWYSMIILLLLTSMALIFIGCKTTKIMSGNDRPIVITGGSLKLHFNKDDYPVDPQMSKRFKTEKGYKVKSIVFCYADKPPCKDATDLIEFKVPSGDSTRITVEASVPGSSTPATLDVFDQLETGTSTDFHVEINFDPTILKLNAYDDFDCPSCQVNKLEITNDRKKMKCKNKAGNDLGSCDLDPTKHYVLELIAKP